jgi:hypothetical protein
MVVNMTERIIDKEIKLVPYYRNDEVSLPWYQNLDVCKQVNNRDEPYDLELLYCMYDYLSSNGDCYYIGYEGKLVGDVSLRDNGDKQSQTMFQSVGFVKTEEEWYEYII